MGVIVQLAHTATEKSWIIRGEYAARPWRYGETMDYMERTRQDHGDTERPWIIRREHGKTMEMRRDHGLYGGPPPPNPPMVCACVPVADPPPPICLQRYHVDVREIYTVHRRMVNYTPSPYTHTYRIPGPLLCSVLSACRGTFSYGLSVCVPFTSVLVSRRHSQTGSQGMHGTVWYNKMGGGGGVGHSKWHDMAQIYTCYDIWNACFTIVALICIGYVGLDVMGSMAR